MNKERDIVWMIAYFIRLHSCCGRLNPGDADAQARALADRAVKTFDEKPWEKTK